jgi:nitrite reductase/ring-hydroxylating ferredoxin subunit
VLPPEDAELTRVGPGTPAGEYLRRFWQPVAMAEELGRVPLRLRIMGEDLVLFRDLGGRTGLLAAHCSHRGTSLEFGRITDRGLRCCYHGWLYDVDGTILETPGEPPHSRIKEKLRHGAYAVREFGGLVFAYLGPPDETPDFPVYDSMVVAGNRPRPYSLLFECNWLQVHENAMDPIHSVFLHATQFTAAFGTLPLLQFDRTPLGLIVTTIRRVGERVWIRSADAILPNLAQFGAFWEDGETEKVLVPAALSRWIVPIDDTRCRTIGLRHFNARVDPEGRGNEAGIGKERVDFLGQTPDRPYPERQLEPGDYDAQVSQRPIAIHAVENLGVTDRGVVMLRQLLRRGIRGVKAGQRPARPVPGPDGVVASFNHDTVIRVPVARPEDDASLLERVGRTVVRIVLESAPTPRAERPAHVEARIEAARRGGWGADADGRGRR